MKKALITGITGQDGSYLAEFLLQKGYEVHGTKRRSSNLNSSRIDKIYEEPQNKNRKLFIHYADLTDSLSVNQLIQSIRPDEVYNLAAQSHVAVSFENPIYTANVNALGTLRILDSIRQLNLTNKTRFYQASTSELYGISKETPQTELTPFYPRSPYGVSKLFAYWITVNYRESYNLFACNGLLFNHESPRRGETFVTRKITRALSRIFCGIDNTLYLGNLSAMRDWGHAKDYVRMQWLMLQQDSPQDFVISSGKQISVKDFLVLAADCLGIKLRFEGADDKEVGIIESLKDKNDFIREGDVIVRVDPKYYRPAEVESLLGDYSKAKEKLGWKPEISLENLCKEMIEEDLKLAQAAKIIEKINTKN